MCAYFEASATIKIGRAGPTDADWWSRRPGVLADDPLLTANPNSPAVTNFLVGSPNQSMMRRRLADMTARSRRPIDVAKARAAARSKEGYAPDGYRHGPAMPEARPLCRCNGRLHVNAAAGP